MTLFDRGRDLFSEVGLVFFDTTSIYFEGAGGQDIGRHGHSKDHRPDLRQMVVGVALDVHGRPICCEMWPGNTTDAKSLLPVVMRMRAKFRVREMCVVADRGMVSEATLETLGRMEPPVHYIVGVRMRRTKEVGEIVLKSRARWQEVTPERQRAKDPAPLKVKEVEVEGRRYIVCLNEEEQRKDAHDRACILEALREQLRRGDKSLIGNKGYRRFLKIEGGGHFAIDEKQVAQEERYDGLFVLRTETDHDAETIARVYKMLWMVEDTFRTAKSIMETRPIFHHCDETIRGHVFCSFLALVLKRELEIRMEQKGLEAEWARSCAAWTIFNKSNSLSKAAAFCFAVNSRAMLLRPSAPPKSPSRPSSRKSPEHSLPAGARCSANTSLSTRKSLIISHRIFETVEDGHKRLRFGLRTAFSGSRDSTKHVASLDWLLRVAQRGDFRAFDCTSRYGEYFS